MSDTKPLTERLRTDAIFDNTTLGNEAADALEAQALQLDVQAGSIEAVQAANQRLAAEVAEHKENAMRNARIAVSIRAERDQLQSKLGDAIQSSAHWQHQFTEVQSRLDGMGKGEPVADGDAVPLYRAAINCPHEIDHEQVILKYDPKQPGHNALNQLGRRLVAAVAAPKALAP